MSNQDFDFNQAMKGDVRSIHEQGFGAVQIGPGDEHMRVIFYKKPVLNAMKSREEGRQVFDAEIFVRSHMPGEERLQENDRPATDEHKRRWPRQWAAFQQNREYVPDGTPIEHLFPANPEIPAMLRWHGFHTIDLLAKATPVAIETVGMGMSDWIAKAKKYLEEGRRGVDYHKIEEMEARHAREIRALQNQIGDLVGRLNEALQQGNSLPTGQRVSPELLQPFTTTQPRQQLKPMPADRQHAAPPVEFIDQDTGGEDDPPDPRGDATRARSERMKRLNAQRRAAK
jgi:hypothetical protein